MSLRTFPMLPSALLLTFSVLSCNAAPQLPTTHLWDAQQLASARASVSKPSSLLAPALEALHNAADSAWKKNDVYSPTNKTLIPPSGTKRDYESVGIYEWPCNAYPVGCKPYPGGHMPPPSRCDNSTGLPWLPCDGIVDHDAVDEGDSPRQSAMVDTLRTLSVAAYVFDNATWATHAAEVARVWFVDDEVSMLPRWLYGQSEPGINNGSHGIMIEWTNTVSILDSIELLRTFDSIWTEDYDASFSAWWKAILNFLMTNKMIDGERTMKNNHGTWYDSTRLSIALFDGNTTDARHTASLIPSVRIDTQILPSGEMPLETSRSDGASYSIYCLEAYSNCATFASRVDVNVWGYVSSDGRSLRAAIDYLIPFGTGVKPWPHPEIQPFNWPSLLLPLRLASAAYKDPTYETAICKLVGLDAHSYNTSLSNILYPWPYQCSFEGTL